MIARAKKKPLQCSTVNCKGRVTGACQILLRGALNDIECARPLCAGCTHSIGDGRKLCRAHKSGKIF